MTDGKKALLARTADENGVIAALAIDQRGAMKKLIGKVREAKDEDIGKVREAKDEDIVEFKKLVSEELTPYTSSILLDPEYGLPAAAKRADGCGLLVAYERTGYDPKVPGRIPFLLPHWSARRLREEGADAVKFLLYYDPEEGEEVNDQKRAFVERIGAECAAVDVPLFVEIVTYDAGGADPKGPEFAKAKPFKVIEAMKEFGKPVYGIDVLKVEVPVNMAYVEGYTEPGVEPAYSASEAAALFKEQAQASPLPYIFLSAGVSADLFRKTLEFAHASGSTFNGVLCGRATWADGVDVFIRKGEQAAREWLRTQGKANVEELNEVLARTATPLAL